jgi:hypothetical protein
MVNFMVDAFQMTEEKLMVSSTLPARLDGCQGKGGFAAFRIGATRVQGSRFQLKIS